MSVRVEDRGKVELIFFNVPEKLNALSANVRKDVIKVLRDFNTNPEKRVAIITGEGKAFSTGADVTSFSQVLNVTPHEAYEIVYDELKLFHQVIKEIRFSDKIYISVANGVVAGAGFSIFMSCDIRYSSSKTRFITAFHSLGFSPDTGLTLFLSRLVGGWLSQKLLLTGGEISGEELAGSGVVELSEDPLSSALKRAEEIANGPFKAYVASKRQINRALFFDLDEFLEYEAELQASLVKTKDFREGVKAFFEKRKPQFVGE